jgi:hypothetical protein
MEMFGISNAVAHAALKRTDYDISSAALQLSDESMIKDIIAEAGEITTATGDRNIAANDEKNANLLRELPSYLIAHDMKYFNELFDLLNLNDPVS